MSINEEDLISQANNIPGRVLVVQSAEPKKGDLNNQNNKDYDKDDEQEAVWHMDNIARHLNIYYGNRTPENLSKLNDSVRSCGEWCDSWGY